MLPVCRPVAVAVGAKVTLSVHEAPAFNEAPHPVAGNSGLVVVTVIGIEAAV
jgi:hypothetical protein